MAKNRGKGNRYGLAEIAIIAGLIVFAVYGISNKLIYAIIAGLAALMFFMLILRGRVVESSQSARKGCGRVVKDMRSYKANEKIQSAMAPTRTTKAMQGRHLSLDTIRSMEWFSFELLCLNYFKEAGFRAEKTGPGPDGGVDIVLYMASDQAVHTLVQCKTRTVEHVGVAHARELLGVMTQKKVKNGILVCNGVFSKEALAFERESNSVMLIDAKRLWGMICQLSEASQNNLENMLSRMDYITPTCPNCEIKLVKRSITGRPDFWGCPNYSNRSRRCMYKAPISRAYLEQEATRMVSNI